MTVSPSIGDYKILKTIHEKGCTTEVRSMTVKQLIEATGYSSNKIREALKTLQLLQYVTEGAVQHNAKTYYITSFGIEKLNSL